MRLAERERKGLRSMEEYERNRYLLGMKKTDQAKKRKINIEGMVQSRRIGNKLDIPKPGSEGRRDQ
jgi:hypothetical protein